MSDFTKLSALVNEQFTVTKVGGFKFKHWNQAAGKMEVSDVQTEGYRKVYQVETDKGLLDLGTGQMGTLLEAVSVNGKADVIGRTFGVKSNGKQGMEIRYFFNAEPLSAAEESQDPEFNNPITMDEIPF